MSAPHGVADDVQAVVRLVAVADPVRGADYRPYPQPAAVPGDVTDGTASEMNPYSWNLENTTTIGLIASAARKITLSFYKDKNS